MWMPSKNNILIMINNCPTIPEYTIEQCFETLTLKFGFELESQYTVKFIDNVGNIYNVEVETTGNSLILEDIPVIDTIYSPLLVEIYPYRECAPFELTHCGDVVSTQFILNVKQANGDVNPIPFIPCCPEE